MLATYHTYVLVDPNTKKIRYVGKTKQLPKERLRRHLRDARERLGDAWVDRTHRANWLRQLMATGHKPAMEILHSYSSLEEVNEAERFFIKHIRSVKSDLTNATDGGDGCVVVRSPVVGDVVVVAEYLSGLSSTKIARKYGTCKKRVLTVLKAHDITLRPNRNQKV
jgi:hypothetical protein